MRDFVCCGQKLATLHDLLQHYEEAHAQQTPQSLRNSSAATRAREHSAPNNKAAMAAIASTTVQQQAQQQQNQPSQQPQLSGLQMPQGVASVGGIQLMRQQQQSQPSTPAPQNVQPVSEDMDGVEDMEMDDDIGPLDPAPETPVQAHQQPVQQPVQQSMFGQQQRPNLNLNSNLAGLQHSGLRTSQPTTPATAGFGFQNNPTVSSVNTPTLSAQPRQQQQLHHFSPQSSVPGTPASEMDDEFTSMPMNMGMGQNLNMANMNFPFGMADSLSLDLCIDEPAKRLYEPNGYSNQRLQQQFAQFGLGQGQHSNSSDLVMAYRHQQMMNMQNPQVQAMLMNEEMKPFRCPVIGCEKAYKNQNGLKYHKTHGHQTQRLHENPDGTFSIVDPETSTPYPGTLGMEKEKPYKCEVCGKRYKNLNGLKYHRGHSPPCNPDHKLNSHMAAAGLGFGLNTGLPGIGEEGLM